MFCLHIFSYYSLLLGYFRDGTDTILYSNICYPSWLQICWGRKIKGMPKIWVLQYLHHSHISKNHVYKFYLYFLYLLPVAMDSFSSNGSSICYVLPVLWTTSCFHIRQQMGQTQRWCACFIESAGGGTGGKVCHTRLHHVSWCRK